jgi:hypothetical protein
VVVGSLVRYIPSPSATFKWERVLNTQMVPPGVIIGEIQENGTTTRRFLIRWHNGNITEEWISYLEPYEV